MKRILMILNVANFLLSCAIPTLNESIYTHFIEASWLLCLPYVSFTSSRVKFSSGIWCQDLFKLLGRGLID